MYHITLGAGVKNHIFVRCHLNENEDPIKEIGTNRKPVPKTIDMLLCPDNFREYRKLLMPLKKLRHR